MSQVFHEDSAGVNHAATNLNNIIIKAAEKSLQCRKRKIKRNHKNKEWFNSDLSRMRKQVQKAGYIACRFPRDPILKGTYYKMLRTYKQKCKHDHRLYKSKLISQLDELQSTDPKSYWKLVDKLTGKVEDEVTPEPGSLYNHFCDMNKGEVPLTPDRANICRKLNELEEIHTFNELDFYITPKEIVRAIKSLKNGKSTGLDRVSNEMLKSGQTQLLPLLNKLFNLVLNSGSYPAEWAVGRITPIH